MSTGLDATDWLYGSLDGGITWANITHKVNGTILTWNDATLLEGANTIQFKTADAAGNQSPGNLIVSNNNYVLDTSTPATLNANANGSIALFVPSGTTSSARSYSLNYTDEDGTGRTIEATYSLANQQWTATGLTGTATLMPTSGTLRLGQNDVLDGSVITATVNDYAGNINTAIVQAAVDTASLQGDPIIAIKSNFNATALGNLIAPVQVEGKWYYFWDHNDNLTADANDAKIMNDFESYLYNVSPIGENRIQPGREAILQTEKGTPFNVLVPQLGMNPISTSAQAGTSYQSTTDSATPNPAYDDWAAIWDAFNGAGTATGIKGVPEGWLPTGYSTFWTSSTSVGTNDKHYAWDATTGTALFNYSDSTIIYFMALQVVI